MIEAMVAIFLVTVGIMSVASTLDSVRGVTTLAERNEAATHVAEQESERILALPYTQVALTAAPTHSADPLNPDYHVAAGSPPTYRWNHEANAPVPHTGELVIDAANGVLAPTPTTWDDDRFSGTIHRYVTWVDDASCGASPATLCPGDEDFKRVTVAVTLDGEGGPQNPIVVSSIASDPDARPEGTVVDGEQNPLESPSTQCRDSGGNLVECVTTGAAPGAVSYFLHDTPASSEVREEIAADHPTHPTVAPSGTCDEGDTSGCPVPDLMAGTPPPSPAPLPPLYSYSTDLAGTYAGGRKLTRDVACDAAPSSTDNAKGALWVTAPLASDLTLRGDGGLSLHTQTVGGASAAATVCVAIYDVPASIANLVASPPTELGRASYARASWPTAVEPVSFTFDFVDGPGTVTVPAGRRIGLRVWAAAASGADLAIVYDHPSHASAIQLNTTG